MQLGWGSKAEGPGMVFPKVTCVSGTSHEHSRYKVVSHDKVK